MVSKEELLAFKRTFKNYTLLEQTPIVYGYLYENLIVIPKCNLCGRPHRHNNFYNRRINEMTIRVRPCSGITHDDLGTEYIVRIEGKISKKEYDKILKLYKKEPIPGDLIAFLDSSEYIRVCEERQSWI